MGFTTCVDAPVVCLPFHLVNYRKHGLEGSVLCQKWQSQSCKRNFVYKRKSASCKGRFGGVPITVHSSQGNSNDTYTEITEDWDPSSTADEEAMPKEIKSEIALSEDRTRAIEKERDQLIQELSQSEAIQHEYSEVIEHNKKLLISELEAAKSMFDQKLEESIEEKFALESKLVLAKQDAVELAVQVEKLAEIAFQQATSHILEDAQMRVSAAETSAAEAAHRIEEQIRSSIEGTVSSIIDQSKDTINKALTAAEQASKQAKKSVSALSGGTNLMNEIASLQSEKFGLQNIVSDLESQSLITKGEIERLKSELAQALALAKASDYRANAAERALVDLQERDRKKSLEREEAIKSLLEKMKKESAEREKAATKAFKAEVEGIMAAVEAAKETAHLKDQAYMRRCTALQRSLTTSEAALEVWKRRAETSESILHGEKSPEEEDTNNLINGGRIDLLTSDNSQKWKLLAEGPRRDIPEWMSRRIETICPKFPPKKVSIAEALSATSLSLNLPKYDEVWSIAHEKPKEIDVLVEHANEKEAIEKKRKVLERALRRKAPKWQMVPEEVKLEPGTGTGREIVFQGFNWESCRRRWYLELAPKAADLSKSGITAIWLPPPTESVAPQGYLPSDLYNLNSAYGSVEELKQCIEELHTHGIMALGDVVLNHRCAQKQSPNGVWNIFGGKLAWGPEAIVCDDPNFQGRGNPSTGDIFHAAPNVDHSQEFVRKGIKEWLNWLRNDIGFDGWRLDFVRGFSGVYVKEYIEASTPVFSIGEYWDSLAYEGGNLCYNQDAHRQRIVNWINATGGTSSAFDVTTKGILHSALHNQYWRLIDPQGKPTGVMGWWPSRAVTFLENHDTGSTQGHWPFPRDKLAQGYAYILTHPGTPVVFYDHFYDFGLRDTITELIEARRRGGIHCRSPIKICHANNEGYVALVNDSLAMKIGQLDWNPSKENHLDGTWQKFVDKGGDYQIWLRQ